MAIKADSNLEAVEEFSRDEDVERAAPEATSAGSVSDFEVIKEAACEDPLVIIVTGTAGEVVPTDSNLEVDDKL